MNNENSVKNKKSFAAKIGVSILLLCVVASIWIFKNTQKAVPPANNGSLSSQVNSNPDFALNVTEKLDLEKLKSYGIPIIIDFGADSCTPCKKMAPVLKEVNEELRGKAIIKFVDVWKYQNFAEGYPISVIPTQVLFDAKGNPYTPKDNKALELNMYSSKDTNEHIFTTHQGGVTKEQLLAMLKEMGMKE